MRSVTLLGFAAAAWLIGSFGHPFQAATPTPDEAYVPYWIYFHDKDFGRGESLASRVADHAAAQPLRAHIRRTRAGASFEVADLPVPDSFVRYVESRIGRKVRTVSKWLNAVSINLNIAELQALERAIGAPGSPVARVGPVARWKREPPMPVIELPVEPPPRRDHFYEYGNSLTQNRFLNLPELHDRGYRGRGVLIGLCDTGFDNLEHNCFRTIDIVATWDFVNDDEDIDNGDDMGVGDHGTKTLSIIGGLEAERMVGAAPEATFLLAKTENTEWERPVEEDYWIAAIEWMDGFGVEVVSSSLGYSDWYEYEDYNGETAPITLAADRAVRIGIVVVNSIGNAGLNNYPRNKLSAPSDGFGVLAIGGTNRDSTHARFSSHGPSFDGRIKPDFISFANGTIFASSRNPTDYGAGLGTSFSCPMVAGLAALLIQANPYLSPTDIRDALRAASTQADNPDTLRGWGIPDGWRAVQSVPLGRSEQVVPLRTGWNTVSLNRLTDARRFEDYLADLVERQRLLFAKDGQGRFYSPRIGFTNIIVWEQKAGYQLQLSDPDTLRYENDLIDYRVPISLVEGWQIVAYFPEFPLSAPAACQSLIADDALHVIKDDRGRFFLPEFDFSNMPAMRPGRGYHIRLHHDSELIYPRFRPASDGNEDYDPRFSETITVSGERSMSVLLIGGEGEVDGSEVRLESQRGEVLATGCLSDGMCGLVVWDRPEGEPIEVSLLSGVRNRERPRWERKTAEVELVEGELKYQADGVVVARLKILADHSGNRPSQAVVVIPQPFNDRVRISFGAAPLSTVNVSLHNLAGQQLVSLLVSTGTTGLVNASLSANDLPSGIYILALEGAGLSYRKRLVHLR